MLQAGIPHYARNENPFCFGGCLLRYLIQKPYIHQPYGGNAVNLPLQFCDTSYIIVENQSLECRHALEDRIIGKECRRLCVLGGSGL